MKNPIESFWNSIVNNLAHNFQTMKVLFPNNESTFLKVENSMLEQLSTSFNKAIPAIQVQAVESLFALDMLNEYEQWDVIGELFENEKNFEHLTLAFAEYKSALLLYGQELLPHQKTMLIKKAIELYPEIDRISFNV
jgi:hypothetical protein